MSGRIKAKDRIAILAQYLQEGTCPEGFEVKQLKNGNYIVCRIKTNHSTKELQDQLAKHQEAIRKIENQLNGQQKE